MGRMSFTQELKALAKASEGADARRCWEAVVVVNRELGRAENALGLAAWTMRYGQRGEWRAVLRDAAAEALREARRAASGYNRDRLRGAVGCYGQLAASPYSEVAELMLGPAERFRSPRRRVEPSEHVAAEPRWIAERSEGNGRRRRGRGGRRSRVRALTPAA